MTEQQTVQLFKCLADRSRLRIVQSLLREEMYVELLAQRLGLTPATISFHLKKLEEAGLGTSHPDQYYTMYAIRQEIFMTNIMDIIKEESDEADEQRQRDEAYREKVIAAFFEYGRLKSIPAQRKKERICLEEIAKVFEIGKVYEEAQVNEKIQNFFDDYCTIRRDMISERIMERQGTEYVRVQ